MIYTDCMSQEMEEEEDPSELKIASMHRYNDSTTTWKSAEKDWLQWLETTLLTRGTAVIGKRKWEEKQLYG